MREILFKAKRMDNGEWVHGYIVRHPSAVQIGESSSWYIHVPPVDPDDNGGVFNVDSDTVCQYTGLTDKNGVRIFESDLMRFDNGEEEFSDYAVDWSNASWKVACDDGSFPGNLDEFFSKRAEVIGNIHDKEADHED